MNFFKSNNSLFDDDEVFGKTGSEYKSEFKPWHKPRKQLIRDWQWLDQIKRILERSSYNYVDTVNYFGLPGGDLLDVNFLRRELKGSSSFKGKKLGVHGFVDSVYDYGAAQVSLTKLLDTEDISGNSKVDQFKFEELANARSEAWNRIKKFGNYHFINLDFCNSAIKASSLRAIYLLLSHQMAHLTGTPWLFCLTTRLNRGGEVEGIVTKFERIITEYLKHQPVSQKVEDCFSEIYEAFKTSEALSSVERESDFNTLLQISLVLWVIKESYKHEHEVELVSSFKYKIDFYSDVSDMHSFVFRFYKEDVTQADSLGLVEGVKEKRDLSFSQFQSATKAIDKISTSLDVDKHLSENKADLLKYGKRHINHA